MNDIPRNNLSYEDALHAMQTGVAVEINQNLTTAHSAKHLRVGVNSALVQDAALFRLLVKKGIITYNEYLEEIRLEMNREVDRYEDRLSEMLGKCITLK